MVRTAYTHEKTGARVILAHVNLLRISRMIIHSYNSLAIWLSCFCLLLIITWGTVLPGHAQVITDNPVVDTATVTLDSNAVVTVDQVFIIGNRRTKPRIILREMNATPQTTYVWKELQEILKNDQLRITNTRLFNRVNIRQILIDDNRLDLIVSVAERWYTIPSPYIKLADRNFNDWRTNYNYDLRRLEYGLKLTKYNFRGLNERVRLDAQFGFTRRFSVSYDKPYIDKAQKNGLNFRFAFAETNNIIYQTVENLPVTTDSLRRAQESLVAGMGWRYRGSYYSTHSLNADFFKNGVKDTITELNPRFYNNRLEQRYFQLTYRFVHDKRDLVGYPLNGFFVGVQASKIGLGIFDDVDIWRLAFSYIRYTPWKKNFFLVNTIRGMTSAPSRQPYANFSGLGYGGLWLRGYEVYAIEGQHLALQQNALSWRIFNKVFNMDRVVPIDQFDKFPLSIYLKAFYDHGAVRNTLNYPPEQPLSNRYLYSAGVAIDVVSFYDFVLRFGYPLVLSSGVAQRSFFSIGASF